MSKLKPCPFCGSKNVMIDDLFDNGTNTVFCGECQSKSSNFCHFDSAVEQWNTRAPQNEWISVDDFTSSNCYVYALYNDIVNSWVELLYMDADKEFFFPHGARYPAIVSSVTPIKLPTPPKEI